MFLREVLSNKHIATAAAVAGAVAAPGLSFAAGELDITGITAALTSAGTAVGAIGAAMLVTAGAGIAFKWVMGFLFG